MKTAYYKLAEMIVNNDCKDDNGDPIFCCTDLPMGEERVKFSDMYKKDAIKAHGDKIAWMKDPEGTLKESYNHRVIALLFMHEMEVNP